MVTSDHNNYQVPFHAVVQWFVSCLIPRGTSYHPHHAAVLPRPAKGCALGLCSTVGLWNLLCHHSPHKHPAAASVRMAGPVSLQPLPVPGVRKWGGQPNLPASLRHHGFSGCSGRAGEHHPDSRTLYPRLVWQLGQQPPNNAHHGCLCDHLPALGDTGGFSLD